MLISAQIANYRSIADLNLSLKKRNVIVGPNGSGKSNLIDCFNFIQDCTFEDLDSATTKRHGAESVPVMMVREPNGERHEFNMSQLSDGTLRMLGMLTAFYQPAAPRRIAIEEPEQMIHPGLLPVLKDAADDYASMQADRQYFMTTHSPTLLDQFDPNDIIWMTFDKGVSAASRIDSKKIDLIREDLFSAGELLVSEGLGL